MAEPTVLIGAKGRPIQAFTPGTSVDIADDGTSAALDGTLIRVCAKADTAIAIGTDPEAAATGCRMHDNTCEYFKINKNDKIHTTGGIINVTIME